MHEVSRRCNKEEFGHALPRPVSSRWMARSRDGTPRASLSRRFFGHQLRFFMDYTVIRSTWQVIYEAVRDCSPYHYR